MRLCGALFLSLFFLSASASSNQLEPAISVKGATIVAFFNVTQKEVDEDEALAEGLSDFQFHTLRAEKQLKQFNVSLHWRYGDSFTVTIDGETISVHIEKGKRGYYYFAPSKRPNVIYGIGADVDIVQTAEEYFQLKVEK